MRLRHIVKTFTTSQHHPAIRADQLQEWLDFAAPQPGDLMSVMHEENPRSKQHCYTAVWVYLET